MLLNIKINDCEEKEIFQVLFHCALYLKSVQNSRKLSLAKYSKSKHDHFKTFRSI